MSWLFGGGVRDGLDRLVSVTPFQSAGGSEARGNPFSVEAKGKVWMERSMMDALSVPATRLSIHEVGRHSGVQR